MWSFFSEKLVRNVLWINYRRDWKLYVWFKTWGSIRHSRSKIRTNRCKVVVLNLTHFIGFCEGVTVKPGQAFPLPLIKITARIDRPRKRKETDKGRGSKSTNHRTYTDLSLTILFSKRLGLLHWLLAANWLTCNSLFGIELQNSPALDSEKKKRKRQILRSTCGKCNFSKNSNRINIRLWPDRG